MADRDNKSEPDPAADMERRTFMSRASTAAMAGGLAASYGTLAYMAGKFLYPSKSAETAWLYVTRVDDISPREALSYRIPSGAMVTITRRPAENADAAGKTAGTAEEFLALSTTCPHLGCRVHWESQNQRFFCPCHNGAFAPDGTPTEGPPKEAGQSLPRYPLMVEGGLLFIQVPVKGLVATRDPDAGDKPPTGEGGWC